ncbi:MAG: SDR family oxidoreductase [archaeon]
MKFAVVGSNGLLGTHLYLKLKEVNEEVFGISRTKSIFTKYNCDAASFDAIEKIILKEKPDIVVNCAKYKGKTDNAEKERKEAYISNVVIVKNLVAIQKEIPFKLIQISTDWIYSGFEEEIYTEESIPYPLNFYGLSKLLAEQEIIFKSKDYLILRTTGLFGEEHPPKNFYARLKYSLEKNEKFYAAFDQYSQPISALELSKIIYQLSKQNECGLFNATGGEYLSRYDFAKKIARFLGLNEAQIEKISSDFREIRIPKYLKVDNSKIEKKLGRKMKNIDEMLKELKVT